MADRSNLRNKLRHFFHWKHAGVLIPLFVGLGATLVGVGTSLNSTESWLFVSAYVSFLLGLLWTLGYWLTSDLLRNRSPLGWNRRRRQQTNIRKAQKIYLTWKYAGCAAWIALFLLFALFTNVVWEKKELSQMGGLLYPANERTPDQGECTAGEGEVSLYLPTFTAKVAHFPLTVIEVSGKPLIRLNRDKDGAVVLSADVLSADGRVVARIDKNIFQVNPNNYFTMKREDRSSLVVVDQYGNEALNARFLNRTSFRLNAKLYSSGVPVDLSNKASVGVNNLCFVIPDAPTASTTIIRY
jgi:hypothetical protein